jgi:hypothetical protein
VIWIVYVLTIYNISAISGHPKLVLFSRSVSPHKLMHLLLEIANLRSFSAIQTVFTKLPTFLGGIIARKNKKFRTY